NAIPLPALNFGEFNRFLFHQNKVYAFRYNGKEALVSDLTFSTFQNVHLPEGETVEGDVLSVGNDLFVSVFLSGLLTSSDGSNWHKPMNFNQSGGMIKVFDGRLYAIPGSGIYRLTADKLHWESIAPEFELKQVQGMWVDSNYIAIVAGGAALWVSSDGGQSFKPAKNEENGSLLSGITNMGKSGGRLFGWDYNFGEGLRNAKYSDDHGFKWKSLKPVFDGLAPLKMDASNGLIHLIDSTGMLYRWNITTQIFDQISTAPIPFHGTEETYSFCPIFVKDETYIVTEPAFDNSWYGIATHCFVSTDAGQSWTEYPVGLGNIVSSGDTIFATNLYEPFTISMDQAATWQSFSEGMESDPFWLDVLDGEVFASSFNQVYRRKTNGELPTVPAVEPTDFIGLSAFPNPFSDHFSVQFSKQKPITTARLYDMLGRQIVLPREQFFDEEILFSGVGHLPRGVYFLEIGFGGGSIVEKMMKF
ncbi:MAG: T9SS type A sorting domain-containing protein, partial [Phycisphaerae bacterium]|nr:T9SS type A sorting domain-containing protein [Saprospiraceae bacterium]